MVLDEVCFVNGMNWWIGYRFCLPLHPGVMPCFGAINAITAIGLLDPLIISSAGVDIKDFHVHVGSLLSHRDPTHPVSQYLYLCSQFLIAL